MLKLQIIRKNPTCVSCFTFRCYIPGSFYKTIRHYITCSCMWLSKALWTELLNCFASRTFFVYCAQYVLYISFFTPTFSNLWFIFFKSVLCIRVVFENSESVKYNGGKGLLLWICFYILSCETVPAVLRLEHSDSTYQHAYISTHLFKAHLRCRD